MSSVVAPQQINSLLTPSANTVARWFRIDPKSERYNLLAAQIKPIVLEMLNPTKNAAIDKLLGKVYLVLHENATGEVLVMPACGLDFVLRKLYALGVALPRAAFGIFRKTSDSWRLVQTGGFIHKFSNFKDQKGKHVGVLSLSVKYSGYFILVVWVEGIGWVVLSKNSADSESLFIQNAARILADVLPKLPKDGRCFCFEILAKGDQVHGYRVHQEAAIHTCATRPSGCGFGTVVVDLCEDVPRADFWSEPTLEQVETLKGSRERATYPEILKVLGSPSGGADHAAICGDVVEGVVVHFACENGGVEVLKIKFLPYMLVTFLVREFLNLLRKKENPADFASLRDDHVAKFLAKWSFSTPASLLCDLLNFAVDLSYNKVKLDYEVRPSSEMGSRKPVISDLPALHICAVEEFFLRNPGALVALGIREESSTTTSSD